MHIKEYRPYAPDQLLILPLSLREWLPEEHLAYFISDLVDQFDLSTIEATYEDELRGGPPYRLCKEEPRLAAEVAEMLRRAEAWPGAAARGAARRPGGNRCTREIKLGMVKAAADGRLVLTGPNRSDTWGKSGGRLPWMASAPTAGPSRGTSWSATA